MSRPAPASSSRPVGLVALVVSSLLAALVGPVAAAAAGPTDDPTAGTSRPATAAALIEAGAGAGSARRIGAETLQAVLAAADAKKACGLSRDQLAAMMLAPIYPEAGGGTTTTPSPMTLSRYDTQAGLYAFGDKNTPYPRAFFHPGIGLWQFDSAGGWNLTAATAISSATAASQAATVMSSRWCANPTRSFAWGPWYGCTSTTICEDIYNTIFDGAQLVNLTTDPAVAGDGGMVWRTCNLAGATVSCAFVDPARAQGNTVWTLPTAGPSPISAPFYVISVGGNEVRYWLSADTGYPTIAATKPITGDARTKTTWALRDDLCDMSATRGNCRHEPFGSLDSVTPGPSSVQVTGWAIDPDTNAAISVALRVDGQPATTVTANGLRGDVGAVYPAFGANHGFSATLGGVTPGNHTVCADALNVGPGAGNTTLGCRAVAVVQGDPVGALDGASGGAGRVQVRGWALDPDVADPITVGVWLDGAPLGIAVAGGPRPDLAAAYGAFGTAHGYDATFGGVAPGPHTVCTYALNVGVGQHATLGCRSVTVPSGPPIGSLDIVSPSYGAVTVRGWAIDPDRIEPVQVHVYVDGSRGFPLVAGSARPDVGGAFPIFGSAHGFDAVLSPLGGGSHSVCAYAIDGSGDANTQLRCATVETPSDPIGALDVVAPGPGVADVAGWAVDADSTAPAWVHVYVDGRFLGAAAADQPRPDVAAFLPAYGPARGFGFRVTGIAGGAHTLCAYAINVGPGSNGTLGCRPFTTPADPVGSFDAAWRQDGRLRVQGWAIDPDTNASIEVHVYVDGAGVPLVAGVNRPDVGAAYPAYGPTHGFDADLGPISGGARNVCAYAINVLAGSVNTLLGCRSV